MKESVMPMPTISVISVGLRSCWIATMAPPVYGPMADSKSVI
jgi:hypothetical protein